MAVETKEQIFLLLDQSDEKLKKFGVKRCGLFGSFLRDRQNLQSDIDLLVEFEMGKKTYDNYIHLAFFLEELFGRSVDLVTPESLSPYIGLHILREVEYASNRT
ncbi:MAG: nucleotidyltransferase family protein [Candidatus Competibacter sp.]|nr:nucleotidyltransferase family protein [Candidatus Competibacter sp.]MDG4585431.1 nucleotidyltransferase family protein [Candidatus Competibacter sp.]